ncbi:serine threonine protein kinase [Plasmopara halstedii]|uniref:Serine threonine protein kinase n=1 Tax=Plasmopara halstedii TaxID=4781 RepID=A0A0P1ALX2_PLAHL|nr:serine threonine protein kinase [Plasmopara halstedii]CEG41633.1 serine threonine protein kinase [Plasmopara halstedii]|eukprot:XP_024578002.1 serine threonine protein kinase [Plasmopara halstedii]
MWWFGPCAGCSCYLSDVESASNWVDLRPLDASSSTVKVMHTREPKPGLYIARNRFTQELVALKVLDRRLLRQRAKRRRLHQEVKVLQLARDHENLLQLFEVKAVGTRVELAFELARGGEVMAKLRSEQDVSHVVRQAAQGLMFLHSQGIVHGEVRPEHLLFSDNEPNARVLLVAFGRAAPWRSLTKRRRPLLKRFLWDDTHHIRFLPPFLLKRKNACKNQGDRRRLVANWREAQQIDVWALGVTLYAMLCGNFPFGSETDNVVEIERSILQDKLVVSEDGMLLSRAARDLLQRLLVKNPGAAMSMNEVVAHPWLDRGVASAVLWKAEKLARHSLFTARYAEEVAAGACRPSVLQSSALRGMNNDSDVADAPTSAAYINKMAYDEGFRRSVRVGSAAPKIDNLEVKGDEEEARSSFVSMHGTQLLLDEEVQQERPSADSYMRLASLEIEDTSLKKNSDDKEVTADPGTGQIQATNEFVMEGAFDRGNRHVTRQKSLDKLWQVLLRQRRFFSSEFLSSGK